jgi:hypothetical protein
MTTEHKIVDDCPSLVKTEITLMQLPVIEAFERRGYLVADRAIGVYVSSDHVRRHS